jgi:hypothetical protein
MTQSGHWLSIESMWPDDDLSVADLMPETFSKMVADLGIVRVAKAVVERGHSSAISEREFTQAVTAHAKRAFPNDRDDVEFTKVFTANDETGLALRKACQIIKGMPAMVPVQ